MHFSFNYLISFFWSLGRYEPGSFFEIDHEKLPPKSPIQLKAIRVVMVSETTLLGVTVSFPSTLSLRSYFVAAQNGICFPELDEKFVMSSNQARRILCRRIPPSQLEAGKRLKSFWLLTPSQGGELPLVGPEEEQEVTKPIKSMGSCHLALQCAGEVGWGIRRKIKYIGRHCDQSAQKTEAVMEEQQSVNGRKRNQEEGKKKNKKKKKKVAARETKRLKLEQEDQEVRFPRGTKDRWSMERYEAAEKRLLEIMRLKKAELGRPILRQALREEARKHIGDTGLLDHLLKHMAGKIVSDGTERFRRRHNSEGAMEYWLEPADLVEVRRKAGVTDPFWVPPPGWKLGDSIFPNSCGLDCKLAIADCKQQLAAQFKRYDEQQISLKKLEKHTQNIKVEWENAIGAWQEKYQILLEWKRKQEEELAALVDCMQELKDDVQLLKQAKKQVDDGDVQLNGNTKTSDVNIENEISNGNAAGGKKQKRTSGFKICKPQGTFLWPSMAGSSAASAEEKQHMLVFPGGGPPSASSSTASTPKLQLLPAPGLQPPPSDQPASEEVAVPIHLQPERGSASENLICTMIIPRCLGRRDGNQEDALAAAGSPWVKEAFGWGGIATDLVLTTPSPYR
ncbi:protein AMEIOTIC 1 homolog isoform X1 [Dendrobium catenatum]|uniref:protein AMEIOTIC 1 homolog isoform X1 n=1 Tax=Dendrobium catenatum TaxID=906689 RepID=UPI0009F38366|nr:protein AMEIOTIC 1 homolog isoform X1 [Dendrobium catenatum]